MCVRLFVRQSRLALALSSMKCMKYEYVEAMRESGRGESGMVLIVSSAKPFIRCESSGRISDYPICLMTLTVLQIR